MRFLLKRCFSSSSSSATSTAASSSGLLRVSLVTPERTLFSDTADQVNISAERGDMGILADHVPVMEQLRPGIVEVMKQGGRERSRFFVAGGFAVVQPGSVLELSAIEAWPVDALNPMAIQKLLAESVPEGADEKQKACAEVAREVYLAMQQAICK